MAVHIVAELPGSLMRSSNRRHMRAGDVALYRLMPEYLRTVSSPSVAGGDASSSQRRAAFYRLSAAAPAHAITSAADTNGIPGDSDRHLHAISTNRRYYFIVF